MSRYDNYVPQFEIDKSRILGIAGQRFADVFVCFVFAIHTSALVSFPEKLAGGNLPGLGFVWATGAFLGLAFAFQSPFKTFKAALWGLPFLLLTIWIWLSLTWTADQYETLRGAIFITSAHLMAFAIAARFTWERIITLFAVTLCSLVVMSVLVSIALPSVGQMQTEHAGAWSGVWNEKQAMGIYSVLALIGAISMASRGRTYWLWWFMVPICLLSIVGTTGRTALLVCFAALCTGAWLRIFYLGVLGKVAGGLLGVIGGVLAILLVTGGLDLLFGALGRSSDLTGRTDVWAIVQQVGDLKPDTGWGFQSIWRGGEDLAAPYQWITQATDFTPANAHSSWWDAYLQIGRPGVFLLALCMIWAWLGLILSPAREGASNAFAGAVLMAVTFTSFTETNLMAPMDLQWTLVPLIATKLWLDFRFEKAKKPMLSEAGKLDGDVFTFTS